MRSTRVCSVLALLAAAGTAAAQETTLIDIKVSTDGVNFSDVLFGSPGAIVVVRTYVSYQGTQAALGLGSFAFQPVVSGWDATGAPGYTDELLPFINGGVGGNQNPGGLVPAADADGLDGPWGRLEPWGRTATSSTNALHGHVHSGGSGGAPPGGWLRIAQSQVTSWIGGVGNTTGNSGVPISQNNLNNRPAGDLPYDASVSNVLVFQFAFRLSLDTDFRAMSIDCPLAGFGNKPAGSGPNDPGRVHWFANTTESTGSIRTNVQVDGTTFPVPSPASAVGLGLLAWPFRRRPRAAETPRSA